MFYYREIDYNLDIPNVVDLIRVGLDSSYTQSFFNWKHLQNPFGKSYGLLAWDGKKLVGLRMFMFWEFYNSKDNKVLRAIRPVDTVVDPAYRGKGLFKNLTLKGLDNCLGKFDLIFNTPNKNSLPGYLKMGWKEISNRSNFKIGLVNPFQKGVKSEIKEIKDITSFKEVDQNEAWRTNKTKTFLKWRYNDNRYKFISYRNSHIIYEIRKMGALNQLVITENYGNSNDLRKMLIGICRKYKTIFIYFYENSVKYRLPFSFFRKSPVITIKDSAINSNKIKFSLGDLQGCL